MVSQVLTIENGHNCGTASVLIERLRGLPAHLTAKIKGQDHALPRICSVLMRGELGFAHPRRPRGSFLFVGPTGVGKTETTNVFTSYLGDGAPPIRFDMSEYQLQSSVDKLIGENRNDPGLLGRAIHGRKSGTLLFDEIEKAHALVLDLFLQILEDGRIMLATGETVDVRPFYVVCTSNIGSEETMRMENAPFASVERTVLLRVRERLRPELVGRVSEIVVFARLGYEVQREICSDLIGAELGRLRELGHQLDVDDGALEFLVREGYHRTLGARPMRGAVERHIQDAVVGEVLAGGCGSGRLGADPLGARLVLSDPAQPVARASSLAEVCRA
jgi:ATP-dependent Clp protease ATP-binding subunit ClpB